MKKYILIIFVSLMIFPINAMALDEVSTIDNKSIGITINMFDYDAEDSWDNKPSEPSITKINTLSPLYFFGQGEEGIKENGTENEYTGDKTVRQGIVKSKLKNNFPELYNGESLAVLFDNNTNPYKRVYKDLNHMFKNTDGVYSYNSDINYAYYDVSQGDGGNFKIYDSTYKFIHEEDGNTIEENVGFYPFDQYDSNKTSRTPKESLESGENGGYNRHFGLTISADFVYPTNGKIDGKDIYFKFSGDDDVWIFIDNVLVLDLGGLHQASNGYVNLTTGEISIFDAIPLNDNISTIGKTNNISNLFAKEKESWDTSQGTKHNIKFFYLERGGILSNMIIETNIWSITGNSGSWRVRFYKDNVLEDTQFCDYSNVTQKCSPNSIKNPTNSIYRLDSCNGKPIEDISSYIVDRNTDLYICPTLSEIVQVEDTGANQKIILYLIGVSFILFGLYTFYKVTKSNKNTI